MSATTTTQPCGDPGRQPDRALRRLASVWSADSDVPAAVPTTSPSATSAPVTLGAAPTTSAEATERDAAMRSLYERQHAGMVRFAAFLCGDVDAAEDIAQEAFAKVFQAWDRVSEHDRLDSYLRATLVNHVRERHRRSSTAERSNVLHLTVVASAEDDAMDRAGRDRILAEVAALPLRQRSCVVMRHWMRMTETEIATDLGLTVGSVRTHIKRGTKTLEQRLGGLR